MLWMHYTAPMLALYLRCFAQVFEADNKPKPFFFVDGFPRTLENMNEWEAQVCACAHIACMIVCEFGCINV
jgi:hypothetical protein